MKQKLQHYYQATKTYYATHKNIVITTALISLGVLLIAGVTALYIYNVTPKITYKPVHACEQFTPEEAKTLIGGDKIIGIDAKPIAIANELATSKCSYTNDSADENTMVVAAIAIRAGINDKGVAQNKADFSTAQSNNDTDSITGLGDVAYFNKTSGQLNILDDKQWIILSYGIGTKPQENKAEDAVNFARLVLK